VNRSPHLRSVAAGERVEHGRSDIFAAAVYATMRIAVSDMLDDLYGDRRFIGLSARAALLAAPLVVLLRLGYVMVTLPGLFGAALLAPSALVVAAGVRSVRSRTAGGTLLAVTAGIAVVSLLGQRDTWDDDVNSTVLVPLLVSMGTVLLALLLARAANQDDGA
jgi:hypothetical protein